MANKKQEKKLYTNEAQTSLGHCINLSYVLQNMESSRKHGSLWQLLHIHTCSSLAKLHTNKVVTTNQIS